MNERQRQRFEKPPVSLPLCYVIEFLICHALLVMIAVLSLFFAAQLGVFHLTPVQSDAGVIGAWTMGRILSAAMLEGVILTCPAHLWEFDVETGEGVNPTGCHLTTYPVKVEGEQIFVALPD